jgi:ribosomal protein S26
MGGSPRGRQKLVTCDSCGRRVPSGKALTMDKVTVYSTEMKSGEGDDKKHMLRREQHYCISCGKHRGLFEKKARQMARRSEKWGSQDKEVSQDRWGKNEKFND